MDDSVNSGSKLEISVSFGRFENDAALSWEKWSSFSPNKYLEEVGSLSMPGSVAQKKAYFEAHYKKVVARKAEELEQERSVGPAFPSPDGLMTEDCYENSPEPDIKFRLSSDEKLVREIDFSNEAEDENNSDIQNGFVNVINLDEENEDYLKCKSLEVEETKAESSVGVELGGPELNFVKESMPVVLETRNNCNDNVEKLPEMKSGREQQTRVLKRGISKSGARNITQKCIEQGKSHVERTEHITQKVTPIKKDKKPVKTTKKKTVSPLTKPLQVGTTRYSKPAVTHTPISASRHTNKKENGPHMPKSNNAPTSLHMSLSLGPSDSLGGLSMMRKSLIMESMGDKDIVKRAFKTFQNRTNGLKADEKPSSGKHVSSTSLEPNVSSFHTPTKGNIGLKKDTVKTGTPISHSGVSPNHLPSGLRKDTVKMGTPSSHSGSKPNHLPSGTPKSSAPSRKSTTAFSPSTALKSDEKSVKRREFLKKLEAKSIAREAANAQLGVKSTAGIASEIHEQPTSSQ